MKTIIKHIFILIVLFSYNNISAQFKFTKVDSTLMVGDYRLAIDFMKLEKENIDNLINMAGCYAYLGNVDSAFYFLEKAADITELGIFITTFPNFIILWNDKRWQPFKEKIEKPYFKKHPGINKGLTKKMWGLLISDQQYRDQYERFRWKYGKKSVELDSLTQVGFCKALNISACFVMC